MLYRSLGDVLTAERQFGDGDVLSRLALALQSQFALGVGGIQQTRVWWRPAIRVHFATAEDATKAEQWIETDFDV